MFTTLILLGLAGLATAAPTASANPSVRIMTYTEDNCGGGGSFLFVDKDQCLDFASGVKSLRVVDHNGDVKYNARKPSFISHLTCEGLQAPISLNGFEYGY
jgi:hypothetical protein